MPGPIIVSAESGADNISADQYSLLTLNLPTNNQMEKPHQWRNQLRTIGEKGRDLQNGVTQQSLAQAIANGLRAPQHIKTTTQKQLPSTAQVRVEIVTMKSKSKTRGNNQAKKRRNNSKKRTVNNTLNVKQKQNHVSKNRGSSRNKKRNSRSNRRNNNKKKKRSNNAMKKLSGSRNYRKGSKHGRIKQVGSNVIPQYSSSTSSFLHGINTALNQHQGYTNGANVNLNSNESGKPVKHPVNGVISGWGGSSKEDPIIWEGGLHTDSGWSGVLQPCACYEPTWGGGFGKSGKSTSGGIWGGSDGKSGKGNGNDCLCLTSGWPPVSSTTFMPTYIPTYYPTSFPTYFPTDA